MLQGKAYQQYLENAENSAEDIDWFTQYIHARSKLKGNVTSNSRDVTYRINRAASWKHCSHLTVNRLTKRLSIAAAVLTNNA